VLLGEVTRACVRNQMIGHGDEAGEAPLSYPLRRLNHSARSGHPHSKRTYLPNRTCGIRSVERRRT